MTLPFVSCLCPTYGRYPHRGWLLEEAVECFLLQDYPAELRELVVLDDTPGVRLTCDAPGVRVVGARERFPSLGEKRNALAALARGAVLLCWDDDDLSLPWRISQAAAALCPREECMAGYWNPRHYWFQIGDGPLQVPSSLGYGHNCSAMTRGAFDAAGGYPAVSGTEDMHMDARLRRLPQVPGLRTVDGLGQLAPEFWPYCYRWSVSPHHLSGQPDTEAHYEQIGRRPQSPGEHRINPRWRHDHAALARQAAAALAGR